MFRVLTDSEAKQVTRWQAPEIKGSGQIAKTRQVATPVRLAESLAGRQVPEHRGQGQRGDSAPESDGYDGTEAGLTVDSTASDYVMQGELAGPMEGQSPDMLQHSYDEGYACGYAEGNAQLHQQSVQHLQALIETLGKPALKVPDAELEQEVMALTLAVARLVLGHELQMDAASMASLVSRGLKQLPNAVSSSVQVHLHPLDAAMLEELTLLPDNVAIVEDGNLKRSDCRIVSGASTVHSGMNDWLAIVGAELGMSSPAIQQD